MLTVIQVLIITFSNEQDNNEQLGSPTKALA
jgi:hypothetical protein